MRWVKKNLEQAVYAEVSGDLGPMILVQKPSQAVYYFDNSVYSKQQVTRLEIDLMLKGSASTVTPPGTFTLNYTDYSVNPSGTNEIIYTNFERLTDSTLVAKGNYTIYGRIVINSASISISSPDDVSYSFSSSYDLDRGQSLLISNEKTISEMKGNANIPDKLVFSYGGNNLTFEYTGLSGEGQISKGSAGNYYYNYYLKDHLGSTRMVINDAGYVTDAIMYQPYGTMEEVAGIATPGVDPERERFTGKEFDREGRDSANGIPGLNAYYFGARFHDPEIGMWMSTDPVDQFWNTYSYCGANTVNFLDPNGMSVGDGSIGTGSWLCKASEAAVGNVFLSAIIDMLVNTTKFEVSDWVFGAMIGFGIASNSGGYPFDISRNTGDYNGTMLYNSEFIDIARNMEMDKVAEGFKNVIITELAVVGGFAAFDAAAGAGYSAKLMVHNAHHIFKPLGVNLGKLNHLQLNIWKAGVKNSDKVLRLPITKGIYDFLRGGKK